MFLLRLQQFRRVEVWAKRATPTRPQPFFRVSEAKRLVGQDQHDCLQLKHLCEVTQRFSILTDPSTVFSPLRSSKLGTRQSSDSRNKIAEHASHRRRVGLHVTDWPGAIDGGVLQSVVTGGTL